MEFSKPARIVGGSLVVTIPSEIVKYYDINPKDLCTLEFVKNLRDGKTGRE